MESIGVSVDRTAERTSFSGVVSIERRDGVEHRRAFGLADRAHRVPMTPEHQLGTASVTKGFTAVTVLSLVAEGALALSTTARSLLGPDLPAVRDDVTVEHLLCHRSGIGDYLDESMLGSASDYVMPVPVHTLADTEDYLPLLDVPSPEAPGTSFRYNNAGFVLLALLAERAIQTPFRRLVAERVWAPAGMMRSAFLRSDELPGSAARGYLDVDGLRSNVLHLPVRGSGDGGAYSTVDDMSRFWHALTSGELLTEPWLTQMLTPRHEASGPDLGYGLGLWLHADGSLELHGYDAGVSFRSIHRPATGSTWTVGSTTSSGSYPLEPLLLADVEAEVTS